MKPDIVIVDAPSTTDLVKATLAHIIEHDEQWDQSGWWWSHESDSADSLEYRCGTTGCFAGWMAHFDPLVTDQTSESVQYGGEWRHYLSYVSERLGVTRNGARDLIAEDNNLDDLRVWVDDYLAVSESVAARAARS